MNGDGLNYLSIIVLFGWAILVFGAYRSYRIGAKQTIRMGLVWAAIFAGVALIFSVIM